MKRPVVRPVVAPVVFTPFAGLMACAQRLTGVLEKRTGLDLWAGDDGVSAVAADILRGLGVPERPLSLGSAERGLSPRKVAEMIVGKRQASRKRRVR